MKFCKDCEWIRFSKYGNEPACASPTYLKERHMVDGNYIMGRCINFRNDSNACGNEAKWFQETLRDE